MPDLMHTCIGARHHALVPDMSSNFIYESFYTLPFFKDARLDTLVIVMLIGARHHALAPDMIH